MLIVRDMNQEETDSATFEGHHVDILINSNRMNELFISDGKQSYQDLINAWKIFTSLKEFNFKEKIIQSCREGKERIFCVWKSQDHTLLISLDELSKKVNWGSLGKLEVPSNVDISDDPNIFLITETFYATKIGILMIIDGKQKHVIFRTKKQDSDSFYPLSAIKKPGAIEVGFSYESFDRKDRKKLLKQFREGKEIDLTNFIPADAIRSDSFMYIIIEFRNNALIKLIEGIFKIQPKIQFDCSAQVREKICWNCQTTQTKLLKCTGCRRAQYCDKECQIEDWGRHEDYCVKKQEKMKQRANKPTNLCRVCLSKVSRCKCVD